MKRSSRDAHDGPPRFGTKGLSGRLLGEAVGIPDDLGKVLVKVLPRVEIGLLELRMRTELKLGVYDETFEAGIMIIGIFVETSRKQILLKIMLAFFGIRQIAVAGVKAFGQKQKPANPIAVFLKIAWMGEFIPVPFRVVRPNMFDFVVLVTALRVFGVA